MAKSVDPTAGFSLKDLMSDNGLILDFGNEFDEEEDDRYKYNPRVNMTEDELVKYMNLEISDDEDGDNDDNQAPIPLGLIFDKIKSKMDDMIPDGKIKKLVRQRGVGEVIPHDSMVTIKYSGYFEGQDEPYDSTFLRGSPSHFRLNQGELIFGLDLAIQSMHKHEVSIFLIHPDLAYGKVGFLPLIPPNAEVMFIIYLVDYLDNGAVENFDALEPEEKSKFVHVEKYAKHLLTTGADNFKRGQVKKAIRDYKRAIDRLQNCILVDDDEERRTNKLLSQAFQNLAVCYNKENMPKKACIACNQVINKTAKTYFHYGRALIKMGEYAQALEKLELALQMDPQSNEIIKEMRLVNELYTKSIEQEKCMWSKCLKMKDDKATGSKDEDYEKSAEEFCNNFQNNEHIKRQAIPDGLTKGFKEAIRIKALSMGLKISTYTRYNKEVVYVEKNDYH